MLRRRKKRIQVASSGYSGSDERCGDSCGWTYMEDGKFAAALSDGTGKGEIAAKESNRAVNAVLGLLRAGTDPEMALQILNLILTVSNRKEQFPTMDLAVLDPDSRELYIYKIGAAATAVSRASGMFEILTAPAMPMGVSAENEIPCIATLVMPGDRIFMMTDGITDSKRNDSKLDWLQGLLRKIKSRNLQTVTDLIIREASYNYDTGEKDDMTVVAVSVV